MGGLCTGPGPTSHCLPAGSHHPCPPPSPLPPPGPATAGGAAGADRGAGAGRGAGRRRHRRRAALHLPAAVPGAGRRSGCRRPADAVQSGQAGDDGALGAWRGLGRDGLGHTCAVACRLCSWSCRGRCAVHLAAAAPAASLPPQEKEASVQKKSYKLVAYLCEARPDFMLPHFQEVGGGGGGGWVGGRCCMDCSRVGVQPRPCQGPAS